MPNDRPPRRDFRRRDDHPRNDSGGNYARAQFRARSHDNAHAEKEPPPTKIPDHPLIPKAPAELISNQAQFDALIPKLREAKQFVYDTEFIGELTYHPKLCLIQVATVHGVSLIDPMAGIDLRAFWELVADPAIEKIVHAGAQDVEPVVRHLDKEPANVFDTQIAAGFVGYVYPLSLAKLVQELAGTRLGKGLTFTHWDQRPLSAQQMRYAADDVRFLLAVHDALKKKLAERHHTEWAAEECAGLCKRDKYIFDPNIDYLKVRGATGLDQKGLAVLKELAAWRDVASQENDLPPRAFLKDEILIDLSRNPARSLDKLSKVKGLPRPVERDFGTVIIEATSRGLGLASAEPPMARNEEPGPSERFDADALWAAAQTLCAARGVDPALVTSRQEIGDLYKSLRSGKIPDTRILTGWRRSAVGDALLALVTGRSTLNLKWGEKGLSMV